MVRRQYRHRLCEQAVYLYPCRRCSSRLFLHPLPRPTPTTRPFSFSTAPTNSFPNPLADVRVRSESEWRPDANAEENNSCATFSACSTTTRTHAGPFRINQRPLDLWCTGSCGVFNIAPGHCVEWGGLEEMSCCGPSSTSRSLFQTSVVSFAVQGSTFRYVFCIDDFSLLDGLGL